MKISTSTNIGARRENQDAYGTYEDKIFVLCDGHGGDGGRIAQEIVEEIIGNINATIPAVQALFEKLNQRHQNKESGSTVSAAWRIENNKFLVAILGDSVVFYETNGNVKKLRTHNVGDPKNPDTEKLKARNVEIWSTLSGHVYQTAPNSGASLQLTRAIGDLIFGENVSKVPDIFEIEADNLVICSDGFTGKCKDVKKLLDKGADAGMFIENQKERKISDNITVIVAYGE